MITTVEQVLSNYRTNLKAYLSRSEELKKKYGDGDFMSWDGDDYHYLLKENARLGAMEQVLALSHAEKEAIINEIKTYLANE